MRTFQRVKKTLVLVFHLTMIGNDVGQLRLRDVLDVPDVVNQPVVVLMLGFYFPSLPTVWLRVVLFGVNAGEWIEHEE
jgi:hypothetical protein